MKIIHVCMCDAYADDWGYHRNLLSKYNKLDGHEVTIITNIYTMKKDGSSLKTNSGESYNKLGIKIIRLENFFILPQFFQEKLRIFKGLYKTLEKEKPDVIMVHNGQFYNMLDIKKYKEKNPKVKFYVDNHADFYNSCKNYFSKIILHKIYYKWIIQKCIYWIDKYFYLSSESKSFMQTMYNIPENKTELFFQGGEIIFLNKKLEINKKLRKDFNIPLEDIVFIHSGKMDKSKKTLEILKSFNKLKNSNMHLLIIGSIAEEIKNEFYNLINKKQNIKFLGWKSKDELTKYLCMADLYLQPGTQSVTMQNALCCGCPVMIYPYSSLYMCNNKNSFFVKNEDDIEEVFRVLEKNPKILEIMSKEAYKLSTEIWDYKKLAARLYK